MTHKQPFSNSLKYLPLRTIKLILEVLSNRIVGLPSNALLSCFISGLKPHIRREVQALQPINLTQAIAFAKLQEDKYNSFKKISPISQPNNTMPSYTKTVPPTATNLQPSLLPKPPTSLPIKTLTPAKLQSRREKGLCYNCDERYFPGHKCKSQFFLLLEHDDDDIPAPPTEPHTATDPEVLPQISLHAMLGHTSPQKQGPPQPSLSFENSLLVEFHTFPTGGHAEISRTYSRLNANVTSSTGGFTPTT